MAALGWVRHPTTAYDPDVTPDIEHNKALVRRLFAAIESGDLAMLDEIVAEGYSDHMPGMAPGREGLKRHLAGLRTTFPDLQLPIVAVVAEGDLVAALNRVVGTHLGEFPGIAPRGKPVASQAFQLYRIADGQLAEHWEVVDLMTLTAQMQA